MNRYKKIVLSNKIPVFTIPIKGAKTATALLIFRTGSRYENRRNNGISHFLEHMFFKGTEKRPNTLALSSELDSLGGEYNAFTSKEYTGYWIKVAADKLGTALEIMADMLLHSKFSVEEIEREKGVIIEELNMYEDNPLMHIEDVLEACLYGDTPAGWETIGTKENIRRFTRADLLHYLKTQYGTRSAAVFLAGNISAADQRKVRRLLAEFRSNDWRGKNRTVERQSKPNLRIVPKKIDQVNLSLAVRAYPAGHAQEFKAKLLAIILGGAMSSRLFIRLRERNGLAYYVKTNVEAHSDSGYLTTQAGVPIGKVESAVKIILEEYKRLTEELVEPKELKRAKDLLRGRLLLQLESTDDLANWYARQEILREKIVTPEGFIAAMEKITASELRQVARQIFKDSNLNLALIGDVKASRLKKMLHF